MSDVEHDGSWDAPKILAAIFCAALLVVFIAAYSGMWRVAN